jgi:tetratricopeptide (TPR) repeat protein
MSVLEAMRDIEHHIDEDFPDEPDVRADVYQQIGDSYRTQELYDDAERNLRKALQLRLALYGEDSAKTAESMYILSGVRYWQGDPAEHERLLAQALSIQRRHPDEGNNLPYMLLDYADLLRVRRNDYAGALPLTQEALELFRRRYGDAHFMVGETQAALAHIYNELGDYAQTEAVAQEHLKRRQPPIVTVLEAYASAQIYRGDYEGAENTLRQLLAQAQRPDAKPEEIPRILYTQSFMAYRRGDYAQAIAYVEKAGTPQAELDDFRYARVFNLTRSLNKLGQAKRAEALLRAEIERLKGSERVLDVAQLKSLLGESLTAERRFAEAETVLLEAYETQKARVLPAQYEFTETRQRLAELYQAWGQPERAAQYRA